jgi:hypothetical protein
MYFFLLKFLGVTTLDPDSEPDLDQYLDPNPDPDRDSLEMLDPEPLSGFNESGSTTPYTTSFYLTIVQEPIVKIKSLRE